MLDFDFLCKRKDPSVAAMVFPFSGACVRARETPRATREGVVRTGNHYQKFYWGEAEVMIPVYQVRAAHFMQICGAATYRCVQNLTEAASKHTDADVLVNFSSFRSVHSSCMEALNTCPSLRVLAIIAEGVPESQVQDVCRADAGLGSRRFGAPLSRRLER